MSSATLVPNLACAAIEQRLNAVLACFAAVANGGAVNPESVHQLRVASRRAVAALQVFRKFYSRRRTARLLRDLKAIRRAAGAARDLDVFTARLSASSGPPYQSVLRMLSPARMEAQQEIADLFTRLAANNRLPSATQAVIERFKPHGKKVARRGQESVAQWAPRRLRKAISQFLDAIPKALHETKQLHSLRVAGKQLRYTLELLAVGLPAEVYDAAYGQLEALQDRLGAINDHAVAIEWLRSHSFAETGGVERIMETERLAMQQKIEQTDSWFRDAFLPQLQDLIVQRDDRSPSSEPKILASGQEFD